VGIHSRRHALLLGAAFLAGCATMPGKENVQAFADALKTAATNFDLAIEGLARLEQDTSFEAGNAAYAAPYRPGSRQDSVLPEVPSPATPNADAARVALGDSLKLVSSYAKRLSEVSGGEAVTATQDAITAASNRAVGAARALGATVTPEADRAIAAFGTIAKIAIEIQAASAVRDAIEKAQPDIEAVVTFLNLRIIGDAGSGITEVFQRKVRNSLLYQRAALYEIRRDRSVNAFERNDAYRQAGVRFRAWRALLAVPDATKEALNRLQSAHAALKQPESAGPAVDDLVRAVNRVIDLYEAARPAAK
jgi:predicted small secreted protein